MSKIQIKKVTFKNMESEWRSYHQTLNEINLLRQEIMNPYQEDQDENVGGGRSGFISNLTERIATRLSTNKQLKYLNEIAGSIEQVYNALPDNYKKLVRLRYWGTKELTWDGIAAELHVSKRQAMRWRDEIIQATIEVMGWR
ncbi:DUF722 domain-containing protein [Evansella clarkii]|uniref:DUF722 domain-containing protein n=1 Tax=Evansella clarkii TaxID=79879 RepID=UPI0009980172|nr:DUF722 domain-containing protein [Evansella clarkii]